MTSVENVTELVNDLSLASREISTNASISILRILIRRLPLIAASLYSYSEASGRLHLRAQVGFNYKDYDAFHLPLTSPAGIAVRHRVPRLVDLIPGVADLHNKRLREAYGLSCVVVIPILQSLTADHHVEKFPIIATICVYPTEQSSGKAVLEILQSVAPFLSNVYQHSLDLDKLRFREQAMQQIVASKDIDSFMYRIVGLLIKEWGFEAVSIFLFDERSETLRLRSTSGLVGKPRKSEVFFKITDDNITVKTFNEGRSIAVGGIESTRATNNYREELAGACIATLCVPVLEPAIDGISESNVIGVLRVVNRVLHFDGRKEIVAFGWEDSAFLEFVASLICVITHMYWRASRVTDDLERSLHGVQNNLHFIRSSLTHFQERSKVYSQIEREFSYAIPDSIDHVNALAWQLERYGGVGRDAVLSVGRVNLYGDVLAKIPPLLIPLAKVYNAKWKPTLRLDDFVRDVPPVNSDADALLTVFRNLLENAIKYSRRETEIQILLSWRTDGDRIYVEFSDNGIGVDEWDVSYIFREGYKAENAMRRCTIGAGIGLSQCKTILRQMDCDINLKNPRNNTTFEIGIPLWKGDA